MTPEKRRTVGWKTRIRPKPAPPLPPTWLTAFTVEHGWRTAGELAIMVEMENRLAGWIDGLMAARLTKKRPA